METAIKLAQEAGWKPQYSSPEHIEHWYGFEEKKSICIPQSLLDPLFWQALGKAEGWDKGFEAGCTVMTPIGQGRLTSYEEGGRARVRFSEGGLQFFPTSDISKAGWYWWMRPWHLFIDHLADSKDVDSFFTALLTH